MKTPKAEGPQEPENKRKQRTPGARPKRSASGGPVGFGNVMRDVRGGNGTGDGGACATASPGSANFDPALAQALKLDPGACASRQMGATLTSVQQLNADTFGVRDATDLLRAQDRSPHLQAQAQLLHPSPVARMTPAALLDRVLDEATRLEIAEASKELHVELEPADLGPLIVRLRRGPDGTLDISFRAREGDAARVLEQGTEMLRERLADAGFAAVAIDVRHDAELRLGGRSQHD